MIYSEYPIADPYVIINPYFVYFNVTFLIEILILYKIKIIKNKKWGNYGFLLERAMAPRPISKDIAAMNMLAHTVEERLDTVSFKLAISLSIVEIVCDKVSISCDNTVTSWSILRSRANLADL